MTTATATAIDYETKRPAAAGFPVPALVRAVVTHRTGKVTRTGWLRNHDAAERAAYAAVRRELKREALQTEARRASEYHAKWIVSDAEAKRAELLGDMSAQFDRAFGLVGGAK